MIIRLAVNESRNFDKVKIIIHCPQIDKQLDRLIELLDVTIILLVAGVFFLSIGLLRYSS